MLSMAQRIDSLLGGEAYADVGGRAPPLSFTVIVPGWLEDAGIQHLKASPFKRLEVAVPKEDHGFCDGAQHQRRDRYLASPFDTIVFVLQNKEGAAKYPIPKGFKRSLLAAFAMSKPTTAAVERRMKAGRGFAAEDGGGGVYKGKKAGGNLKGGEKRKSGAVGSEGGAPEKRPRLKHPRPQAKSEPKPKPKLKPKANQPRARQLPPKQQQRRQPQPQPPKAKAKAHQKAQKQKQHDPNRVVEF